MKFKVGDWVHVYSGHLVYKGEVTEVREDLEMLQVKQLGVEARWYSPKQCRRVVKKPRRRIWVHESYLKDGISFREVPPDEKPGEWPGQWIPFIEEVRKAKP